MHHVLTAEGEAVLAAVLRRRPLLVFDFDGTLAPIVPRPDAARISQAVAVRLRALAARLPVAVVTGRTVDDVRRRLGFDPHYVIGNHGAASAPGHTIDRVRSLEPFRARLDDRAQALSRAGVGVEDKGLSIALHYRLSRDRERALALIDTLLGESDGSVRAVPGKMAVDIVPADAPDLTGAVHELVVRSGASGALFVGDDLSDEPVFASAPAGWLTVRVGRDNPASRANFVLDGPQEVALLLERALSLLVARSSPDASP